MAYFALYIFPAADGLKKLAVDRPERNPQCDSVYTRSASCCSRTSITRAKILPTILKRKIPM